MRCSSPTTNGDITMKRRKFVVGLGSLAAGGAAAMGTGAFSFAQTDRNIELDVVADNNAYLALQSQGENSEYSELNNGKLEFNLGGNANVPGDGLNPDSVYLFDGIGRIANQGNQKIELSVPDTTSNGFWSTNFVAYVGQGDGTHQGNRQSIWPKDGKTSEFDARLNSRTNVGSLSDLINTGPDSVEIAAGRAKWFGVAIAATDEGVSKSTGITLRAEEV